MKFNENSLGYVADSKEDGEAIRVSLYYDKGGMNYFSGSMVRRGIYLSVSPVAISNSGGYKTVRTVPTDGVRICLQELKRKSAKQLEIQKERIEAILTEIVDSFNNGSIKNTLLSLL